MPNQQGELPNSTQHNIGIEVNGHPVLWPRCLFGLPLPDGVLDGVGRRVGVVGAGHVHLGGEFEVCSKRVLITIFTYI